MQSVEEQTGKAVSAPGESAILVFEVCHDASPGLRAALSRQGMRVWTCRTGRHLQNSLARRQWSLVLIDYPHPVGRGVEVCERTRSLFGGPVVLVSAPVDDETQLRVLRTGVDAIVEWPVSGELLGARLAALLRRGSPRPPEAPRAAAPFQAGGLRIDPARREVHYLDRRLALTSLEFDLLALLARNLGSPVSREAMYRELRGSPFDGRDRSMDLRVSRLRKKLTDGGNAADPILTIRGTGYQLAAGLI